MTATVINAAPFNANFNATAVAVNSVDNTNIGAAGLFASNLIPTTAGNATFGGVTAGVGYKFLASATTSVPLTVSAIAGQSVDIFDITQTSGGVKAFAIDSVGVMRTIPAAIPGDVWIFPNATASTKLFVNVATTVANIGASLFGMTDSVAGGGFTFSRGGNLGVTTGIALGGAAPAVVAGQVSIGATVASTVGAAGGASALPATPLGYLIINVAGTAAKIPYYVS